MKKYYFLFLFVSAIGFSQNLNEYKYALVPSKFSFLKEENMYNLNSLTKLFMEKYGFETYLSNEAAPNEFIANNCNKVFVDVIPNNNIFTTRVKVVLKDCRGTILYTSEEGTSKDKEYRVAYNQALRMAFDGFSVLKTHKYLPSEKSLGMIGEPSSPKVELQMEKVVNEVPKIDSESNATETTAEGLRNRLSVVTTELGFDLYNTESKLVYSAKRTSLKNVYIATSGVENGILKKDYDGTWYFEYYREGGKKLISEPLQFKF